MPSMSPRTQQFQMAGGAGQDQAEQAFEKGFSDMAYSVLLARFPDLMPDVVTFKILDTDLDKGMGVGAFVVQRGSQTFYVPVVLSDNNLKPIELLYHKQLNLFLPLTKAWLEEADKSALGSLGAGIKTPETLYSDVDIRNVVVPPITGRFSYAEYVENPTKFDRAEVVAQLEKTAAEPDLQLVRFLDAAPNLVKEAMRKVLERHPRLLKHAAHVYGVNALAGALRPRAEKTAAKQLFGGGLWIADRDTTPTEFKSIFGDRAAEAYAGVRKRGWAARDDRFEHNMAVKEQPYERWEEPRRSGVYVLYGSDTSEKPALVVASPIDVFAKGTRYGRRPAIPGHNPLVDNSYTDPASGGPAHSLGVGYERTTNRVYPEGRPDEGEFATKRTAPEFLAVLPSGNYLQSRRLVGRDSVVDEIAGGELHRRLFKDLAGEPRQGLGFWVRQVRGTDIQATVPVEIRSVTTDSDGVRRVKATSPGGWEERDILTDKNHPFGQVWMPTGANVVYLPPDFVWVQLKERLKPSDFFTSAHDLLECMSARLSSAGARKVSIKNAAMGQFSIDGARPVDRVESLKKLAVEHVLKAEDAEALLEKAAEERHLKVWVVTPAQLGRLQAQFDKTAADDDKKKSSGGDSKPKKKPPQPGGGGAPGAGAPGAEAADPMADPMAQAQMMAVMQPPEPPPPSPIELAAMEFQQHIDSEQRKLQEQAAMIAALTQRAQEIQGGAPPMPSVQTQAMGAPPAAGLSAGMSAPPPGVGAAPLPGMGQPPPMGVDPSMAGGAPGAQPPMDPSMMGGQPPMDPSMGGQPPMDPSMMGAAPGGALPEAAPLPPSMAMMGPDGANASTLDQQINPQFLGQAGQLSPDVFDAAAVSSLAQSPAVKELIGNYLPNLEKALDNLGRVQLTLWMQEPELKGEIGEAAFTDLEDNLRNVNKGLGDLVLRLSQGSHVIKGQFEHEEA